MRNLNDILNKESQWLKSEKNDWNAQRVNDVVGWGVRGWCRVVREEKISAKKGDGVDGRIPVNEGRIYLRLVG